MGDFKNTDKNMQAAKTAITQLRNETMKQTAYIKTEIKHTGLFDSKLRGIPYLPNGAEIPTDSEGHQLTLLAQINCNDIKEMNDFPHEGILQFFVLNDDVSGVDFDDQTNQDTFRVVYYDSIDTSVTEESVKEKYNPHIEDDEDYFPVEQELALSFVISQEGISAEDYRIKKPFLDIYNKLSPSENISRLWDLDEDVYNTIFDSEEKVHHKLGGYPYFTQQDPRSEDNQYASYDTLLLQIDSEWQNNQDIILWGDCGVCNFFINHEDLKNKDFSKVIYNWDCY